MRSAATERERHQQLHVLLGEAAEVDARAEDEHAEAARGVEEGGRDQAAHPGAEDALGGGEARVGERVEDERGLRLVHHLVLEAARVEDLSLRAREPAARHPLEPAVRALEVDGGLLGPQVLEGAVQQHLEQLVQGLGGGERAMDLVQQLETARRLALGGGEQLGGGAQHDRVARRGALLARRGRGGAALALDRDHGLRELHEVARADRRRGGDRSPVQQRRVARAEVLDHPPALLPVEPGVLAGEEAVGQDEVGTRRAPDYEGIR